MINTSQNITKAQALAQGGYVGQKGTWNALYVEPKTNKILRDRVEVLVIKDNNKLFMRMHGGGKYRVPGGGCEHSRTKVQQAIEETKEEARILINNVRDTGIEFNKIYNVPGEKAKLEGDKAGNILWYGSHTTLFIAEYDSEYYGDIKKIDQDPDLTKYGDFYPLDIVWNMLREEHREALTKFNYFSTEEMINKISEATTIVEIESLKEQIESYADVSLNKVLIENAIDTKLEDMFSNNTTSLPMYPYFTPQELIQRNLIKEENDWLKVYLVTGDAGYNYKELVTEVFNKYKKNPTEENKQRVYEMAWNPSVDINTQNIARANQITKNKLNEFYNLEIVNICEVDSLIDTVENLFEDLGKQIRERIEKAISNSDTTNPYDVLKNKLKLDVEQDDNPNIYCVASYNLSENDGVDYKILNTLVDETNKYLASIGYRDIEMAAIGYENSTNSDDLQNHGILILRQIIMREQFTESASEELGIVKNKNGKVINHEVGAQATNTINPAGCGRRYVTDEDLKKIYKKKVNEGYYSGDIDFDYHATIADEKAKELGQVSRLDLFNNLAKWFHINNKPMSISKQSLYNWFDNATDGLNIYSGDDYKEVADQLSSCLRNSDYIAIPTDYNTVTIIHKIGQYLNYTNESAGFIPLNEAKTYNRKGVYELVQRVCREKRHPLKVTKKGQWGLEKFLAGDSNTVNLICGYKNDEQMVKDLNKELKGTGFKASLDNYNSVFLDVYGTNVNAVTEDAILNELYNSNKQLCPIFIVNSFTDTRFGNAIVKFTGDDYSHSAIALDSSLSKLYSFNAGNGNMFGGFNVESIQGYAHKSNKAKAQINVMFVSKPIHDSLKEIIEKLSDGIEKTSYNFGNLFNIVLHREDKHQNVNNMICSQFVDNILKTVNIDLTNTPSNLVTPGQLARVSNPRVFLVFEGLLKDFNPTKFKLKLSRLMNKGIKPIKESRLGSLLELVPVLEAKSFPIQFDTDGNLLIKNRKKLDYDKEWRKTKKLRKDYIKFNNIESMKYEAAKCWYLSQCIEKELDDEKHSRYSKEDLTLYRSRVLTEFSQYMKEIMKVQNEFNFTAYYNSTPFSDDMTQINSSTLKYASRYVKNIFNYILL